MKKYVEKYDAVIDSTLYPITQGNDGDMLPHKHRIHNVIWYMNYNTKQGGKTKRIFLTRDMIVDLYNEIQELEKQEVLAPFDSIPF